MDVHSNYSYAFRTEKILERSNIKMLMEASDNQISGENSRHVIKILAGYLKKHKV